MKLGAISKILLVLGILLVFRACTMPVSIGHSGVVNIHLISERQNALILGCVIFLSGIILFALVKSKQSKEEEQAEQDKKDAAIESLKKNVKDTEQNALQKFIQAINACGESYNSFLKQIKINSDHQSTIGTKSAQTEDIEIAFKKIATPLTIILIVFVCVLISIMWSNLQ